MHYFLIRPRQKKNTASERTNTGIPIYIFHETGRLRPILATQMNVVHTEVIKAAGNSVSR